MPLRQRSHDGDAFGTCRARRTSCAGRCAARKRHRGETLYALRRADYAATAGRHPYAEQEIILPSKGLHADEKAVARTLAELHGDTKVLIAVGSGTIHDIACYCAHERGLHFVSCPTAASVDGFCSTVAAMTWHGYKKTLPAVAPEIQLRPIPTSSAQRPPSWCAAVSAIFLPNIPRLPTGGWRI